MRRLSQGELLQVWESGLEQSSLDRTLAMLRLAGTENPEQLTVGQSDRCLLQLRELMFGHEICALARCSRCDSALELNFTVADISTAEGCAGEQLILSDLGYEASFRLLTLADLKDSQAEPAEHLRKALLERCLLNVRRNGDAIAGEALPEAFVHALSERMGQADPQAEIRLELECFECHHRWTEQFDVQSFFWTEIHAWASQMLNEVHQLAAAYGWSEQQILALSPVRRHIYLNLATD